MTPAGPAREVKGLCPQAVSVLRDETAHRADLMVALCALMPARLGGIVLEGATPPAATCLADRLASLTPGGGRPLRLPAGITDDRLAGGLDLAATLACGRPVSQAGILADANDRCLVVPMAERLARRTAAQIAMAMDRGQVSVERDGVSIALPAVFPVLLLCDPADPSEGIAEILACRLAFRLEGAFLPATWERGWDAGMLMRARQQLRDVSVPDEIYEAFAVACRDLGIADLRIFDFLCASAAGIAALNGHGAPDEAAVRLAASLVLGPRLAPPSVPDDPGEAPVPEPPDQAGNAETDNRAPDDLAELVIASARFSASLSLAAPKRHGHRRKRGEVACGKSGETVHSMYRGARLDARPGDPRRGGRMDLVATLRAAAPWQKIRPPGRDGALVRIQPADFRLKRFRHRSESVIVFAVDASGSAAMNRLGDAKGAVEYLLSGCYARRESVALVSFRRDRADVLLPPTRSLTRVKKCLAGLPGGGGTPLAAGISLAARLSEQEYRRRRSPFIVFLSDGQANIALDGRSGRKEAMSDAGRAARQLGAGRFPVLFLDTSPRPRPEARELSALMKASYHPLPYANARSVSETVRTALSG